MNSVTQEKNTEEQDDGSDMVQKPTHLLEEQTSINCKTTTVGLTMSPTREFISENTEDLMRYPDVTTRTEKKEEVHFFNSLVDHKELTQIIWGDEIKQDNFERWSQGFIFDKKEPTALLQFNGGPCAVIAAVQAFLLRELLFCAKYGNSWRMPDGYFLFDLS